MSSFDGGGEVRAAPTRGAGDASWIGQCIQGRYRIEDQLGAGGMGTVYRARHLSLDRLVALKLLRKQHNERWVSRQRFEREARALAQLSHPNVVAISDCGIDGDTPFLVMELLLGESLEARLRGGPLPQELGTELALQLLEGLAFAHERGLVHRDVKPGNVFIERVGQDGSRAKLLDFGLAKFVVAGSDVTVTKSGEIFGTPAYMSPEQITGEATDARTDVYAAGLLVFEMLAGRKPFLGGEPEVLRQQMVENVPSLQSVLPGLRNARQIDAVIQQATAKEPAQRFADARAMARALALAAQPAASPVRRTSHGTGARLPNRAAARREAPEGGVGTRVLRAGAVILSGFALSIIVLAGIVIFLLAGAEGASRRASMQRTLSALLNDAPRVPPAPAPK